MRGEREERKRATVELRMEEDSEAAGQVAPPHPARCPDSSFPWGCTDHTTSLLRKCDGVMALDLLKALWSFHTSCAHTALKSGAWDVTPPLPAGSCTIVGQPPRPWASVASLVERRCTLRSFSAPIFPDFARLEMISQQTCTKGALTNRLQKNHLDFHDNDLYTL